MENAEKLFADFATALDEKELELIRQKKAILAFVVEPHTSDDTKKHMKSLRGAESVLNDVMEQLFEIKVSTDFKEQADKLCGRCRELNSYTREMDKVLSDDLTEQYRAEDKKKRDLAKDVTFLLAPSAAFITAVKNGFGNGTINVYEAAGAGIAVSGGVLFHKRIFSAFSSVANDVCAIPKSVSNSFTLYYMKETLKSKTRQTIGAAHTARSSIGALLTGRSFATWRIGNGKRIALFPRREKKPAVKVIESERNDAG